MLVTPPALHLTPTLAKHIVTVDHLSGGRLDVGLGAGGSPIDGSVIAAVEPQRYVHGLGGFARFVAELDDMLVPSEEGHASTGPPPLSPSCLQRPRAPFTVAGRSEAALELAVRFAARWNFYATETSSDPAGAFTAARDLHARLDRACERLGRDPRSLRRSVLVRNAPVASAGLAPHAVVDHLVQGFSDAGIDEVVLFWPIGVHFSSAVDEEELLAHAVDAVG